MILESTEIDRLIYSLVDGTITSEEHDVLQKQMLTFPSVRERYLLLVELHSLLEAEGLLRRDDKPLRSPPDQG